MTHSFPDQRWQLAPPNCLLIDQLVNQLHLDPLIAQVMANRSIADLPQAQVYLIPEQQELPPPQAEFIDLLPSVAILKTAIERGDKIGICGDYDADGMTSTALLMRAFKHLGANADYVIPSRMKDGYGINERIVEELHHSGFKVIVTVDNGIAAYDAIAHGKALGMQVIITDHHDLPERLPPADTILNPKLLSPHSLYSGLAGVGVAYILAISLAQAMGQNQGITRPLLELYTLGTIADLAPLIGVNRRWLKRGLKLLPHSEIPGIQALMQTANIDQTKKQLQPDHIGFQLGPRINAVGRIGDPQDVINLLTTDSFDEALKAAQQCEQTNRTRQQLCEQIEEEAIATVEQTPIPWQQQRVLVVVRPGWHHGVIGIVASRLVERYGVPVFIGSYEEQGNEEPQAQSSPQMIRGSARGIDEFNVFEGLCYCQEYLGKFGGHPKAGGFSMAAENLELFTTKLSEFAHRSLEPHHLKPLIKIDGEAKLSQLTLDFFHQLEELQPWGISNPQPIFWTSAVTILAQKFLGKTKKHLQLTIGKTEPDEQLYTAIVKAWRWGEYFPLPSPLDVAYTLGENHWQGKTTLELTLVGVRAIDGGQDPSCQFELQGRFYQCALKRSGTQIEIKNSKHQTLLITKGQPLATLEITPSDRREIDVTQGFYHQLAKTAATLLQK